MLKGIGGSAAAQGFPFMGAPIACLGDSITANNSTSSSTLKYFQNIGYATWFCILSKQAFYMPLGNNFGVSGDTIAMAAIRVPALIAAKPSLAIVKIGINDITGGTSFATMKSGMLQTILQPILGAGIPVAVMNVSACSGGNALTTAQNELRCQFNTMLRELAFGRSDVMASSNVSYAPGQNIFFIDDTPFWEDLTTGACRSGLTQDGKHPNQYGAFLLGQLLNSVIPTQPPRPTSYLSFLDVYDATNNPSGNLILSGTTNLGLLQGTGGTKLVNSGITPTGNVANGWQIYANGVTSTTTLVGAKQNPRLDLPYLTGERQEVHGTSTSSGGSDEQHTLQNLNNILNVSAGDTIEMEAEYQVLTGTNCTGLEALCLEAGPASPQTGGCSTFSSNSGTGAGAILMPSHSGVFRTPPFTCQNGVTNLTARITGHLNTTLNGGGGEVDFLVGSVAIRKQQAY